MIKPLKIGNVQLANNLVLAPMSGVTNICFRNLIQELNPGSVGLLVTEFISIEGITRENEKSLKMMKFNEIERPISIQIFGHDIGRMADAAMMVENAGADIIDINCGCPVPKVVKKGGGCELMRQPEHLEKILKSVYKKITIPLTLKIRSGWDQYSRNAIEIAKLAEQSGVAMLAVHGRTRKDLYRGVADWSIITEICDKISIPVIGSGDVVDYQSASERMQTGASGAMIGRAALSNPWVFSEIIAQFEGRDYLSPDDMATVDVIERYRDLLMQEFSEKAALGRLKQFASQVTRRVRGSSEVRKSLCTSKSVSEYSEFLKIWRNSLLNNTSSRDFMTSCEELGRVNA